MTEPAAGTGSLTVRFRDGGEIAARIGAARERPAGVAVADQPGTAQLNRDDAPCEFHVAAGVRRKYRFAEALFRSNGNAVFPDFRAVREFAAKMNTRREPGAPPVRAGDLNAMGLIDEILHYAFRLYESAVNPGVLSRAAAAMEKDLGAVHFRTTMHEFADTFPPVAVFRKEQTAHRWLEGATDGRPHPEVALEELLMLHLSNINPAFAPFRELFDDTRLAENTSYGRLTSALRTFLRGEKEFGPGGGSILDLLEGPMRAHPGSLALQLGFIRDRWGIILSDEYRRKILSSGDLSREDSKQYPTGGRGPVVAPDYSALGRRGPGEYPETENFTHDIDWMPNVVLLAKNAYVWLAQLSKAHGRRISRLDEVPDAELDRLASWNFTSLWLIGVWHRSSASGKIKRMTGNPEAAPSAYSLYDYEIAPDLGGEQAFGNLAHRAWQRGIRLAADMVPNHTGITSRWMKEHPDYFIQAEHPPFPAYRFTGPDLSDDPDYQVRIEDGYWTRSDASVVFQQIDNRNGRLRYLYHGNDGTNMPWNDTAQLDFLKSEVREAVIGQILHVARKFSVIRFDAAMTLAKKHFQRLWYPHPGTGGDIPSRADYALTQEEFDRLFPVEFWREVVDRINSEMPETLLLAEAFWLLEGYFVRTLGMHRVYNSAFMHMLMKEDNAMYRAAIRSTLHFNPEILKRYVNFMSNPDEETAVDQFGKGDKYFGIATLMVTLPGLPMFAHGQVEGYREKYGMEYRRDYHDETPDAGLVRRHEREIFPLLKLRRLFSQTEHFELYDVTGEGGAVIEDVFAYSNLSGDRSALVCYNNRYTEHAGTLKMSTGKLSGGSIRYPTLGEALHLKNGDDVYYLFRELRSGLEYLRTGAEIHRDGLFVRLRAFETQVFLDFREVPDNDGAWARLHGELKGGGVRDASRAARTIRLRPFHGALATLFEPAIIGAFAQFLTARRATPGGVQREIGRRIDDAAAAMREAATRGAGRAEVPVTGDDGGTAAPDRPAAAKSFAGRIADLRKFFLALEQYEAASAGGADRDAGPSANLAAEERENIKVILGTLAVGHLLNAGGVGRGPVTETVFEEWLLGDALESAFSLTQPDAERNAREARMVRCLVCTGPLFTEKEAAPETGERTPAAGDRMPAEHAGAGGPDSATIEGFFSSPATAPCLLLNEYQGVVYFHKESFEELVTQVLIRDAFRLGAPVQYRGRKWTDLLGELGRTGRLLARAAGASEYRFRHFLRYLQSDEFLTLPAGPGTAPPTSQPGP
jgi:glycosidase